MNRIRGRGAAGSYGAVPVQQRSCARPGCGNHAIATLSYQYSSRTVWLEDLHPEPHPANHDLCTRHAERMKPPNGWQMVDRRASETPLVVRRVSA